MSEHMIESALIAARDYLRQAQNDRQGYGYFLGGDPRDFSPDEECCTEAELSAHKEACAAWDRGERPAIDVHRHEQVAPDVLASHSGALGIGVYTIRDDDADDVLEQVEAALASLSGGVDR